MKIDYTNYIEENIISFEQGHRGGIIKVNVEKLFPNVDKDKAVIGAYCNYLGGGMIGSVAGGSMFRPEELEESQKKIYFEIKEQIKKYFFSKYLEEYEDWAYSGEEDPYQLNQDLPFKAY